MKKILKSPVLLFLLLLTVSGYSQEKITLSGHIRDAGSGEELIGANIYVDQIGAGASTNVYGFYSLSMEPNTYRMVVSYLGYETQTLELNLTESKTLDIEMQPEGVMVAEIVVTAKEEDQNVKNIEMSVEKLTAVQIKKIPQVMGEADLIRSIQLLPGVSTVGEGAPASM